MGCCSSTARLSSPPPASAQAPRQSSTSHTSRHPITAPPRRLSQVFNSPLKPHFWSSTDRLWTASTLSSERQVFWDTAITNRAEIWASLHLVCDELISIPPFIAKIWDTEEIAGPAAVQRGEAEERVRNAQAIVDAAGITLPTGDLVDGAYDGFGNHYALPVWVVCQPENIASDSVVKAGQGQGGQSGIRNKAIGPVPMDGMDEDDMELLKGKGTHGEAVVEVEQEVEMVSVRFRLTDGRQDVVVKVPRDMSVTGLIEKVEKVAEAPIRLVYLGKMLTPNISLSEQGWKEGNVVQALVFPVTKVRKATT